MSISELIVEIIAYAITIGIIVFPFYIGIKIIKAIRKRLKKQSAKRHTQSNNSINEHWNTGWKWDEKQQLWVHPKSENANSTYRYTKKDIPKEQPTQQTHFHHTDTAFKSSQQPEPKVTVEIPHDVLDRINKAKQEPVQEETPNKNLTQKQIDSINQYRISFPKEKSPSITYKTGEAEDLLKKANQAIRNTPPKSKSETDDLLKRANSIIYEEKPKQYYKPQSQPQIIYTYKREELPPSERAVADDLDFMNAYQRRQLFTKNEWQNYKKLKDIAEAKEYIICPKVRLFDLIEPRADKKKKLTYRYKIQAKHVDFVICDKDMNIKAILELDDNSHKDPERMKRDDFVNTILLSVGYTVIHTKYIDYNILDLI